MAKRLLRGQRNAGLQVGSRAIYCGADEVTVERFIFDREFVRVRFENGATLTTWTECLSPIAPPIAPLSGERRTR